MSNMTANTRTVTIPATWIYVDRKNPLNVLVLPHKLDADSVYELIEHTPLRMVEINT